MNFTLDFKRTQQRLDKRVNPVKFKGNPRIEDLADILSRLLFKKEETAIILKNGKERHQCPIGRARSVLDAYVVVKSYIPGITYEKVYKTIDKLKKNRILNSSWCCSTGRMVHSPLVIASDSYTRVKDVLGNENIEVRRYPRSRKTSTAF